MVQVCDRLVVSAECGGTVRGAGERQARLGGDRIGLRPLVGGFARRQVVVRERAGQLVIAEPLEVAGGGQVTRAAVPARQRPVGDLADERLDELVLAPFGRPRIRLDVEQLATHEVPQLGFEVARRNPAHASQRIGGEDLAEHRGVLEERPIGGLQRVEPRGDQRAQRIGNGDVRQVADRLVDVADASDATVRQQAAHRLDGVEGDALGTPHDRSQRVG